MSDVGSLLRTARGLLPSDRAAAGLLIAVAALHTVDPRLRSRINAVLAALAEAHEELEPTEPRVDRDAALQRLDRALEYLAARRRCGNGDATRQGLTEYSAAEMVSELRRRGFVAIVYTPKELIEIVEDLELPNFDSSKWLNQHYAALETSERAELQRFLRCTITGGR